MLRSYCTPPTVTTKAWAEPGLRLIAARTPVAPRASLGKEAEKRIILKFLNKTEGIIKPPPACRYRQARFGRKQGLGPVMVLLQTRSSRCPGPLGVRVSGWCGLNAEQILLQVCLGVALLLAVPMLVDQAWRVLLVARAPFLRTLGQGGSKNRCGSRGQAAGKERNPLNWLPTS